MFKKFIMRGWFSSTLVVFIPNTYKFKHNNLRYKFTVIVINENIIKYSSASTLMEDTMLGKLTFFP